jgi:hypothetical protein
VVQRKLRRSYWKYLHDIFHEAECPQATKDKRFWSYIQRQKTTNAGISPLRKDGKLFSIPLTQATILNEQFQSAFSEGTKYTQEEFRQKTGMEDLNVQPMENITFTEEGVRKLLNDLHPNKASGPDGIGPRVLKELSEEVAPALAVLFQSSMTSGVVPADWRDALVAPIYKKGEHYDPANYRPISLTCVVCKIMEHVVASSLMSHLDSKDILSRRQHGFRRGRSCESQLLEFVDELTRLVEGGGQADVLIMDFAKAFDKCNHSLLVHKLNAYGIQDQTNTWISNFLENRRQSVVVDGFSSSFVSVRSGVPQGSVLGPSLFLVYINDLPDKLDKPTRLFADDTAVYGGIKSLNDQQQLQNDLAKLADWEERWDMEFHPNKCTTLRCTLSHTPRDFDYELHGHTLANVTSARYLGVTIHQKLDWDDHINKICSKANSALGFLRRNLKISSPSLKEKAYKAFVRPILEYSASVWDPYEQQHKDQIEKVQRRAARFVLNRYHNTSSVTGMLGLLNWETLEQRRRKSRLVAFYKMTNGYMHCDDLHAQLQRHRRSGRTGNSKKYAQLHCTTNYRMESFLPRTIKDWNILPETTVEAENPDTFVSRVSNLLN